MNVKKTRPGGRTGTVHRGALPFALATGMAATGLVVLAPTATAAVPPAPAAATTTAAAPAASVTGWTRVAKKHPDTTYWKSADALRAGNEGGREGLSRSFLQIDTAALKGAQVTGATLRLRGTASATCTAKPVELWSTGAVTAGTSWRVQPAKGARLATVTASRGAGPGCPAGELAFDVTALLKDAAAAGRTAVTVGLYAADENDTSAWKRFDPKSVALQTAVTAAPTVSALATAPATPCTGGLIGNTQISLSATVDGPDPGGLSAEFQVFAAGSATPLRSMTIPAAKGRPATWPVADADLPSGAYTWHARATDAAGQTSAWSPACAFSVDRTRPAAPPVISSPEFPDGAQGQPAHTGAARTPGTFTFATGGVEDLAEIVYWSDSDAVRRTVAPGGSATITPLGTGPQRVYAYGVDKAGNRSDTAEYLFYAVRATHPDVAGDLNGDGHRDLWTLAADGRLQFRAGKGDGTFAAPVDAGVTLNPAAQIVAGGDWGQDGYNDLVVLEPGPAGARQLWVYPNTGLGAVAPADRMEVSAFDSADDHWAGAQQLVSAGDVDGDGLADLLVREGGRLWTYRAAPMGYLDAPVSVGGAGWDAYTVVSPGDTDGDGAGDLWLREDATGDLLTVAGAKGADGRQDVTAWGSAAKVRAGSGFGRAAHPVLGSAGDVTGDGFADLWATGPDGTAVLFRGTATGVDPTPVPLG
ncbi:FG-GAP-like repeat-containing protein [Streptomyces sp. NPDC059982]|uniref:FG-GAP-like repeat-containing protein n=1 Tax=unclassified Streptomyces TaxID=2593676 RepID=UPI0036B0A343